MSSTVAAPLRLSAVLTYCKSPPLFPATALTKVGWKNLTILHVYLLFAFVCL